MTPDRSAAAPARSAQGGSPLRLAGLVLAAVLALVAAIAALSALLGGSDEMAGEGGYVVLPTGQQAGPGPGPGQAQAQAQAYEAASGYAAATRGLEFADALDLRPVRVGVADTGYAITADSDMDLLAGHRLRAGDVLLDMDGRKLDPARIAALGEELGQLDAVEITMVRQGETRQRLLTFD
ncbi:hypothetical protein [Croceicoccus marinus]|uniref:PDZ domain-containing protein n=1 Tax=Croceicoccus marinus TaxID=450378 RepID=A0A7G6VWK6_9SPHN|nr:hypothetical protein [Croceicoccus marinus]QNE06121.1 hypothetical protein H4O24_05660 [Croceicoccus marinus]